MRASTANSPELTQARMSRDYLSKVFAHRLSLTAVAQSMIQGWLEERFVGARLRAHTAWIGVIQAGGGYTQLITLSDALIKRCMSGEALNYTPGHHQLLTRSGERVFEAVTDAITVDDIEQMLNALAPGVLEGFAERLVDYWNERVSDGSAHSRWDAVGRQLRACLMTARQNPPLSSEHARALLGQGDEHTQVWSDRADREALGQPHVLRIYQVFAVQNKHQGESLPLLVLQRQVQGQRVTLLYVPALNLLTLDNLDALGNLLPRYMNHYLPGFPSTGCCVSPRATCSMPWPRRCWSASYAACIGSIGRHCRRLAVMNSSSFHSPHRCAWFDPTHCNNPTKNSCRSGCNWPAAQIVWFMASGLSACSKPPVAHHFWMASTQ